MLDLRFLKHDHLPPHYHQMPIVPTKGRLHLKGTGNAATKKSQSPACAGLWIKWTGFEYWLGHRIVFLGKTLIVLTQGWLHIKGTVLQLKIELNPTAKETSLGGAKALFLFLKDSSFLTNNTAHPHMQTRPRELKYWCSVIYTPKRYNA